MINKKGFTLVELLAVVAIMAVIALIAVPNVVNMLDRGKKEQFIVDANEIISKSKYKFKLTENPTLTNNCLTYDISTLGYSGKTDAYDNTYSDDSYAKVCLNGDEYEYYVYLITENHCLGNTTCTEVLEEELDLEKVIERNDNNY